MLKLLNALGSRPLPVARRPVRRVRVLPAGERTLQQFVAASQAEVNSATEVYFQVGGDEADDWVLLTLLSQVMSKVRCSLLGRPWSFSSDRHAQRPVSLGEMLLLGLLLGTSHQAAPDCRAARRSSESPLTRFESRA